MLNVQKGIFVRNVQAQQQKHHIDATQTGHPASYRRYPSYKNINKKTWTEQRMGQMLQSLVKPSVSYTQVTRKYLPKIAPNPPLVFPLMCSDSSILLNLLYNYGVKCVIFDSASLVTHSLCITSQMLADSLKTNSYVSGEWPRLPILKTWLRVTYVFHWVFLFFYASNVTRFFVALFGGHSRIFILSI